MRESVARLLPRTTRIFHSLGPENCAAKSRICVRNQCVRVVTWFLKNKRDRDSFKNSFDSLFGLLLVIYLVKFPL